MAEGHQCSAAWVIMDTAVSHVSCACVRAFLCFSSLLCSQAVTLMSDWPFITLLLLLHSWQLQFSDAIQRRRLSLFVSFFVALSPCYCVLLSSSGQMMTLNIWNQRESALDDFYEFVFIYYDENITFTFFIRISEFCKVKDCSVASSTVRS